MRTLLTAITLSPILIPQAVWTVIRAARLPEAAGPRNGRSGHGKPLRILITGDSSAAGVGAGTQEDALAGQVAAHLSADFDVSWQVIAKSGDTTASTRVMLRNTPPQPCDIVIVALGVNDTKNGVSAKAWERNYLSVIAALRTNTGARHIYVSGLPPLGEFPLLPAPLRTVLGTRARQFDRILQRLAADQHDVTHIGMDIPLTTNEMASDGFHPGPRVYTEWARLFADRIRQDQTDILVTTS